MNEAPLTFGVLDDLAFAAANGRLGALPYAPLYSARTLGPLLEWFHLSSEKSFPILRRAHLIKLNGASAMVDALVRGCESWMSPRNQRVGFIRAQRHGLAGPNRLTTFLMDAQRAARSISGLPAAISGQVVAAMEELEGNIHDHSVAADTGVLAFRASSGLFEFVAADHGIGILRSLQRCSAYAAIPDHGRALETALAEGTSRYGPDSGHGNGFRPIFTGLANLRGTLRFRSGDHALAIDGTTPNLATAQLAQKPDIKGFFASVAIRRD